MNKFKIGDVVIIKKTCYLNNYFTNKCGIIIKENYNFYLKIPKYHVKVKNKDNYINIFVLEPDLKSFNCTRKLEKFKILIKT